jgi:WD40 repeat protein
LTGNRGERLGPGAFSPDGRYLAIPDSEDLCVWDLNCPSRPVLLDCKEGPLLSFFSADSSKLFAVSGHDDAEFGAWHIRPSFNISEPLELIPLPTTLPTHLKGAGQSGSDLVLSSEEGVRFVPQTNLTSVDCRIVRIPEGVGTVSPDGRWFAVIYPYSPLVTVYRLPEVQEVAQFSTSNFVASLLFAPAGDELTVINRSGVEQWDTATWRLKARQPGLPVSDSYVLYTPDGSSIWRVTNFRDTALHDRKTLEPILPLPSNVLPLAASFDGRKLAVSVDDQHVQVWDMVELRKHFRELGLDWEKPSQPLVRSSPR